MDSSKAYSVNGGQVSQQVYNDDFEEDYRPEKSVEDMVRYVRQVGKLNKANRSRIAGTERSNFDQG